MLERLEIGALSYETDETDKFDQNKSWYAREILLWDSLPVHVRAISLSGRAFNGKLWRKSRLAASRIKNLDR
jgi:hypothetical protein